MRRARTVAAAVVLLSAMAQLGWAGGTPEGESPPARPPMAGLAVHPGGLLIQGVQPGQTYSLRQAAGTGLTIFNRDRRPHTYVLSSLRPSQIGPRRVPLGYSDVPDPAWVWFDQAEVIVPAEGSAEVEVYLRVPQGERHLNQHWSVSIGVVGKPTPGESLALAVYPRFEVETAAAPRADLRVRPVGEIAVCPSRIAFPGMAPGGRGRSEFVLVNSDDRSHRYRLSVLAGGEASGGRRFHLSGGRQWLPDPGWVQPEYRQVRLHRRWTAAVPLRVRLPRETAVPECGWEAIILVERDDGMVAFARVLLDAPGAGGRGDAE